MHINFHKATWFDCLFLLRLRNKPETYKYFCNNYPAKFFGHLKWFFKLMSKESNKQLFVIAVDGPNAGQIRFDRLGKTSAEISISILGKYMGKSVMSSIFLDVVKKYLDENPDIKELIARINKENLRSINFFKKFGFKKSNKKDGDWLFFSSDAKRLFNTAGNRL